MDLIPEFRSWLLSRVKFFILVYRNIVATVSKRAFGNSNMKVDEKDENNNAVAKGFLNNILVTFMRRYCVVSKNNYD